MHVVLDALIFVTAWVHVVLAPYTKVEESFNIHAIHDVLMYGVGHASLPNYDHFVFPGAVPRTFIGSVILAWLTAPAVQITALLGLLSNKFDIQILARLVLASLNAWTLCLIRKATTRRFGRVSGLFFALFTCSQFHYPFWMGRTIPNMFATVPVNIAIYLLVRLRSHNSKRISHNGLVTFTALLAFSGVVFRAEVALLLAPFVLHHLWSHKMSFTSIIKVGVLSGFSSIALTVAVDSYFWGKSQLWPEFAGIYFNVIQGKSAEWGTSPFLTYFTSYLPKLLMGSLPLALVGLLTSKRIAALLLPAFAFIGLMSFLGHKEWRFIIYVVPLFNVAAAAGARLCMKIPRSSAGNLFARCIALVPIACVLCNLVTTILFSRASIANYPGGQALSLFHQLYPQDTLPAPHVHISNLAAQTGATLFLHLNAPPYYPRPPAPHASPWVYNKTENLTSAVLSAEPFTHLISEVSPSQDAALSAHWRVAGSISSFDSWAVDWALLKGMMRGKMVGRVGGVLRMQKSEKLWILERDGGR